MTRRRLRTAAGWDWGHPSWPYARGCDDLCNTVLSFSVPFVGWFSITLVERDFSEGWWYTSGACYSGDVATLGVTTYSGDEDLITADILVSRAEADAALGGADGHPRIWSDSEVLGSVLDTFWMWDPSADDFVRVDEDTVRRVRASGRAPAHDPYSGHEFCRERGEHVPWTLHHPQECVLYGKPSDPSDPRSMP